MSDLKPKRRKRGAVSVKQSDGTWRELETRPAPSNDPEIVRLWDMPIVDLQKILDDPEHPLFDKALVVTEHAFSPLQEALQEVLGPIESLAKPIEALVPKSSTSWISEILPKYPAWQDLRRSRPKPERTQPFVVDSIDFDAATPPTASLSEVASAADDAAVVVLKELLIVQREQLAQAKLDASAHGEALDVARTSLNVARGSRKAGWWAAGAALAAAVISAIGIIVTVASAK